MCGIAGAFSMDGLSGPPLARAVIERMTEIMRHRGPDDAGFAEGDGMSLGARRLSIIDVHGGHQPLSDESGHVWAAQNGFEGASVDDLAGEEKVIGAVQEAVDAANDHLSRVEQIKKFKVLPTEWAPGGDELTPTMKLKRKPIAEKYSDEIEALYA